jgi:hypothetical protein
MRTEIKLAPAQLAYALAKARFREARGIYLRLTAHINYESKDFEVIANQEEEAGKVSGYYEACDILRKAEKELFDWAQGEMRKLSKYQELKKDLDDLYENARRFPKIYDKLIYLCMRLKPFPYKEGKE